VPATLTPFRAETIVRDWEALFDDVTSRASA